jgi:hypothetical protein
MVVPVTPNSTSWSIIYAETSVLADVHRRLGDPLYQEQKLGIKELFCGYVEAHPSCDSKLGKSISPMARTKKGYKVFKFRWALPGSGKSGGLRLILVANCEARQITVASAYDRRSGQSDDDSLKAAEKVE